jgi:hypothetical protein
LLADYRHAGGIKFAHSCHLRFHRPAFLRQLGREDSKGEDSEVPKIPQ